MDRSVSEVLIVGWPGAGWKNTLPLLQSGKLPVLEKLVEAGSIGRFLTPVDATSIALWTSLATGTSPSRHQVLQPLEPNFQERGLRPTTCLGRQTPAIWNLLTGLGVESHVFGWPASHPAEPIGGISVSDFYSQWPHGLDFTVRDWHLEPASVHPASLAGELASLRMHPAEIKGDDLVTLIPQLAALRTLRHPLLKPLAVGLSDTVGLHAAATHCIAKQPAGFRAVVYPGIDRLGRLFGKFHGDKHASVSEKEHVLFQNVMEGVYIFHDQMLGRLLELVGKNTVTLVISPEGHRYGEETIEVPGIVTTPSEVGMFVLAGRGVKKDHLVYGTRIQDFTPTVLHLLGQPVPRSLDGAVIADALESEVTQELAEDTGGAGLHPAAWRFCPEDLPVPEISASDPVDESTLFIRQALFDWKYRFACGLMATGEFAKAIKVLEATWKLDPGESRYSYRLMHCYVAVGRTEMARESFQEMMREKKRYAPAALRQWKALQQTPEQELSPWERHQKTRLWKRSRSNISGMSFLHGWLLHGEGRYDEALEVAEATDEQRVYNRVGLAKLKADCHFQLKKFDHAIREYQKVAALDPELPDAFLGMAKAYYEMRRFEEAAEAAQGAINLRYFNPVAHYYKAASLYQTGWRQFEVIDALKIATTQEPGLVGAWQRLMLLHQSPAFGEEGKQLAAHYERKWREAEAMKLARLQARVVPVEAPGLLDGHSETK